MPHRRHEWLTEIKAVEEEYVSMRLAADRLLEVARRDPTVLRGAVELRHLVEASAHLEGTYVIRLFAEFETGLRLFWATIRESEPPAQHLLDGIAARRAIPPRRLESAHAVREYRNSLVHRRGGEAAPIPIAEARSHLCRFFAFLPLTW
jgi:hypothetical protein